MGENIKILQTLMIVVYMGISTYFDFRWKRIPWWIQGTGVIFLCIYSTMQGGAPGTELLLSVVPGIVLLGLSFVTKESIGYGDGVTMMIVGGMIGLRNCVWVICISLVMISVVGIVLMIIKRASGKTRIPYIPFMFAAESLLLLGVVP